MVPKMDGGRRAVGYIDQAMKPINHYMHAHEVKPREEIFGDSVCNSGNA